VRGIWQAAIIHFWNGFIQAPRIQRSGLLAGYRPHGLARPFQLKDFNMSSNDPTQQRIEQIVKSSDVVLFMKGTSQFPMCGFSGRAIQVLKACGVSKPATVNVLEDEGIRNGIKTYSNWPTIPQLYVKGEFVGGSDIMMEMYENGELQEMLGAPKD
jgi:monothiol glutaredoxin